jgi:Zn-dependent protease with chaperone function
MPDPLDRTLNQLDGFTERPAGLSPQGERARDLRNVPLRDLSVADLRTLIAEQQGLAQVVPLALDLLETNPDAAGGRFAGDLLAAVERLPSGFWLTHPTLRRRIERIQARRLADLD